MFVILKLTGNGRAELEAVGYFMNKRRHVGTHERHKKLFTNYQFRSSQKKQPPEGGCFSFTGFQISNFFFINLAGEVIDFISQLAQFYIRHSLLILDFFQNFCALRHA